MTDTTVYLIDPYLAEVRPAVLPVDFASLLDEGLMLEACRVNETDVLYAVEHHIVQRYWVFGGLKVFGPGCIAGRTRMGEFLDQPRIAFEELASSVEFGCEMEPIHLETGFHPWRDQTGTNLTRSPLVDLNNPLKQ